MSEVRLAQCGCCSQLFPLEDVKKGDLMTWDFASMGTCQRCSARPLTPTDLSMIEQLLKAFDIPNWKYENENP